MISSQRAQARNQLFESISKAEAGEAVTVTRRGRLVVHLVKSSDDGTPA